MILFYYFIFDFVHSTLFDFGLIFDSILFDGDDKIPFVNNQNIIINQLINFIKNKQFYLFYNTSLFLLIFLVLKKGKNKKNIIPVRGIEPRAPE